MGWLNLLLSISDGLFFVLSSICDGLVGCVIVQLGLVSISLDHFGGLKN